MHARILFMPALLAAGLLAGSAMGQSANNTAQPTNQTSRDQMREQLRQSLMNSGFTDIRIQPEAFVVHAKASDGSPMVLMVSPDQVTEVIENSGSSGPATPNAAAGSSGNAGANTTTGMPQTPASSAAPK